MTVAVHRSVRELPPDAVALLTRHQTACLQFGAAWLLNLEQAVFAGDPGITYFVLRESGAPVAVLPLLMRPGRLVRHAQALGNYYTCLYEPALAVGVDARTLAFLFRAVRRHRGALTSLTLSPMNPDGAAFEIVAAALTQAGFGTARFFCFGNWYLQAPEGWPAYLASRDGKLRNTIKRMTHKLVAEQGQVEIITRPADLDRGLAAYAAVYAKSWKIPEPSAEFIPGLMRLCLDHGALRLGVVWLHGQPIAAQLWIVFHGRAEIYKVAYDEDFKSFSPGTVLTAHLIQHVLEVDAVSEVDYLIGDDPYKKNWMNHRRERWGLVAYNKRSLAGLAALTIESAKRTAKPWLLRLKAWRAARMSKGQRAPQPPR